MFWFEGILEPDHLNNGMPRIEFDHKQFILQKTLVKTQFHLYNGLKWIMEIKEYHKNKFILKVEWQNHTNYCFILVLIYISLSFLKEKKIVIITK